MTCLRDKDIKPTLDKRPTGGCGRRGAYENKHSTIRASFETKDPAYSGVTEDDRWDGTPDGPAASLIANFHGVLRLLASRDKLNDQALADLSARQALHNQFVLFGDSITQFANSQERGFAFASALQDGKNDPWPLPGIASWEFNTVWFGANDAMLPGYEQHVTPDQYRHNLISIITHPVVQAQHPRVILITPPPVDEYALAESGMGGSRTAERTRLYADITVGVGEELGVAVLDIWTCLMEKSGWQSGSPLNGSLEVSRSWAFSQFFIDGEPLSASRDSSLLLTA
ncbi:MAG: hypothetical protein M1839_006739 [Geoglossum umbratile]|nr:MAG: hypothetical protein M1839_006739 [Geoglossum umbratile]